MSENRFIYAVKLLACFAVITIHVRFPGEFGNYCFALARFAVPFFFAVSGRFLLAAGQKVSEGETSFIRRRTLRALSKICRTTLHVYLVYLIFSIVYHILNGISLKEWFSSKFNPGEAINFFLFNSGRFIYDPSYTFDHLWFLFALIYVYGLIFIFAPVLRKWYKGLIIIFIFFLFFGEALQTFYPIRPFGININTWFVMRNWLFVGMPFVLIGILFSDHAMAKKKSVGVSGLVGLMHRWKRNGFIGLVAGIVSTIVEYRIFGSKEVYMGSLIIAVSLLFLSESGLSGGRYIWKFGKAVSNEVYYYHVLVLALTDIFLSKFFAYDLLLWIKPIYIMLICIVFILGGKRVLNSIGEQND